MHKMFRGINNFRLLISYKQNTNRYTVILTEYIHKTLHLLSISIIFFNVKLLLTECSYILIGDTQRTWNKREKTVIKNDISHPQEEKVFRVDVGIHFRLRTLSSRRWHRSAFTATSSTAYFSIFFSSLRSQRSTEWYVCHILSEDVERNYGNQQEQENLVLLYRFTAFDRI